jgi:hypothetical protein
MNIHTTNTGSETLWVLDSKLTTKIILYKRKREREREREKREPDPKQKNKTCNKISGKTTTQKQSPKNTPPFFPSDPLSVRTGFLCRIRSRIRTTPGRTYICISSLIHTYIVRIFVGYRVSVLLFLGTFCYTDFCDGSSSPRDLWKPNRHACATAVFSVSSATCYDRTVIGFSNFLALIFGTLVLIMFSLSLSLSLSF